MKKIAAVCAAVLFALVLWTTGMTGYAGFGDFNNYDSGDMDSDWGSNSGGNSYGGGYDSGSSWDIGYFANRGSSDGEANTGVVILAVVLIVVVSAVIEKNKRKQMKTVGEMSGNRMPTNTNRSVLKTLPDRTNEITRLLKERDPNFTANDFISYVKRVYVDIQDAWCKRDLTPVQRVLHPNLYQQTQTQIEKKIADGIVNHLERIAVNTTYLTGYRRDAEYEYLMVYLAAQMIDYQVKEETGHIIYGDTHTRWDMRYNMTFMRAVSMLTPDGDEAENEVMRCPNCGAPIEGTAFGTCAYCSSVVSTGKYGWVLSDFGVIREDTIDEGIHVE